MPLAKGLGSHSLLILGMSAMQNQHRTSDHGAADFGATGAPRTLFTGLMRCPNCKSSRPMIIKGLRPAMVSDTDRITYRCTACGAERTEQNK